MGRVSATAATTATDSRRPYCFWWHFAERGGDIRARPRPPLPAQASRARAWDLAVSCHRWAAACGIFASGANVSQRHRLRPQTSSSTLESVCCWRRALLRLARVF
jgi:hypothetical protein